MPAPTMQLTESATRCAREMPRTSVMRGRPPDPGADHSASGILCAVSTASPIAPEPPPPLRPGERVPPERFNLPVDRIREGYYSDKYFVRTRDALMRARRDVHVTMQVFQKQS